MKYPYLDLYFINFRPLLFLAMFYLSSFILILRLQGEYHRSYSVHIFVHNTTTAIYYMESNLINAVFPLRALC